MAREELSDTTITHVLSRETVESARGTDAFVHALRLARAANTLRFVIDHATAKAGSALVELIRARSTGGMLLAAGVYEALYLLGDKSFQSALRGVVGVEALNAIRTHPVTERLLGGYLPRMRNKLTFHYGFKYLREALVHCTLNR